MSAALMIAVMVGGLVFAGGAFGAMKILQAEAQAEKRIVDAATPKPDPPDEADREWVSYNRADT